MFNKVLVANRGEIAARIIRACQEMGVAAVAVYSEADATALHTRLADEAVFIGPPEASASYLAAERIIEAAQSTGCEAIHPGYGFLAENAGFAQAVRAAGLTFVGPGAEAIHRMGSKTAARATMQAAGVPVVPGYHMQADEAAESLLDAAEAIGYPILVKASAGGGGKGMRLVETAAALPEALESARREAAKAFGDARLYLEKYISDPRHIEIQLFGDGAGNIVHLFERECSIQRRHQKIIEESPSPFVDESLRRRMGQAAVTAARAVNYVNAGTVEFLVDVDRNFYFLEMNTRLQVEHPVTELAAGVDLVKLQLRVAAGQPLPFSQADLTQRGHAIECRLYAEDAANNFLPDIGPALRVVEPQGPGIRVDAGVAGGDEVTRYYDPLLAKLIVFGENRPEAIRKMVWALSQYIILGVTTNLPFLQAVLSHEAFHRGATTTHFIERHFAGWQSDQVPPDATLVAAALAEMLEEQQGSRMEQDRQAGTDDVYSPWERLPGFRLGG